MKLYCVKDLRAVFPNDDLGEGFISYRDDAHLSQSKDILPPGQEIYNQPRIDLDW